MGTGGAEQGCIDVAKGIVTAGGTAIVVSNGGSRVHELARFGVVHIDLPVHTKNPLKILKNSKRLRRIIKKHNVNVVHARSRAPAWSAYMACKKAHIPFITTFHAPYKISNKWKLKYNSVMAKSDLMIAVSQMVAHYIVKNYEVDKNKIRLIPRGIGLDKFHPTAVTPMRMVELSSNWRIPDGANVVMLPGRITRLKGHHVLIDAMAKLNKPDVFCLLIGPDQGRTEYRQELEKAIADKGLDGRVRLVDRCDDMPSAYMLASVVVCASTEPEGFGRIPIEAMAMGRPIIGTNHGGVRETIIHGETGWLVPPNDADALAKEINNVLEMDKNERALYATRAMAHVAENYTRETMVGRTLSVYKEVLA